jgi:hypothetical protein
MSSPSLAKRLFWLDFFFVKNRSNYSPFFVDLLLKGFPYEFALEQTYVPQMEIILLQRKILVDFTLKSVGWRILILVKILF